MERIRVGKTEHVFGLKMTLPDALSILREVETDLVEMWQEIAHRDNDYRLGDDSYGYDDSCPEGALANLAYISDRWSCAFRIAWMLGLLDPKYRKCIP